MQGIILAAGMGKRLKELTRNNTKCMVRVNGVTLIERMLRQLEALHLSRIVIVIGYEGRKLVDYIAALDIQTPICYVENTIYDKTNNIYSLSLAQEYLVKDDTILLESDLIFEDEVLKALIEDPRETLALVDKYESWMDGTCMKIGPEDTIETFVSAKKFVFEEASDYYKTVNIYKFSRHFSETHYVPFLKAYTKALGDNEYYEQVLKVITVLEEPEIKAKKLNGQLWYEIDDIQDLDIAESMFAEDAKERVEKMQARYGGYWRYPRLLDFCYLVNPYFPPEKLISEMKSNLAALLTQYPSGMQVNSLLAAKNFGVLKEHIVIGNGAAELIKYLMERLQGKIGVIRPTFEEYPNRCREDELVVFVSGKEDFSYTADDIMEYFEDKDIRSLLIINPDNPTGNYIQKADMLRLISWCADRNIQLIADESFTDFSEEEDSTLILEEIINRYPNLVIIKSISKSYGVPGIRLGILVSAEEGLVASMKKEAAIWNINSFGEFYMQIAEKYRKDYEASLERLKAERRDYMEKLSEIEGLKVIPSQANYVMAELTNGLTSEEVTNRLLSKHNCLIKDLSKKIKDGNRQFIRLAVRSREDNRKLLEGLKDVLKEPSMDK